MRAKQGGQFGGLRYYQLARPVSAAGIQAWNLGLAFQSPKHYIIGAVPAPSATGLHCYRIGPFSFIKHYILGATAPVPPRPRSRRATSLPRDYVNTMQDEKEVLNIVMMVINAINGRS